MEGEKRQLPMEERLATRMGIPFRKIRMGKLQRQLSLRTFKHMIKVLLGFWDAYRLLRELKPKVIVAFGGYVAFPMVIVGKLLKANIVLHEQTSSIGLTNKLLERYATTVALTFETSLPYFKKSAVVVGSPTMPHIYSISDYDHLVAYLNKEKSRVLEEPEYLIRLKWLSDIKGKIPILLMSGGSQGSHFLNEQMKAILPELLKTTVVIMQVGENEYYDDFKVMTEVVNQLPNDLAQHCIIRRFVFEEYGYLMKIADLFLGRSGANTVYQVGMNMLHGVFVPIPWVTRNEQYTNAMVLKEKGFAEIIEQDECTPQKLLKILQEQLKKSEKVVAKEPLFPLDADQKLAREIGRLAV